MIGRSFVYKEFGVLPHVGWNLDAFGHSDQNTRLLAQLGYDATFYSRLDGGEKDQRS